MIPTEIKSIQKNGIDWFGDPLKQDGDYGPKTRWWHQVSQYAPLRIEVLRRALGYHAAGMGEIHGNDTPNDGFAERCLQPVKLKNKPWCIAFVSLVLRESGVEWKKYHVSAWSLREWAKQNNLFVTDPIPGDIFTILYPKKPNEDWKGHGGFYIGDDLLDSKSFINSCDGNVADRVCAGRRKIENDMKFIRLPSMGTGKPVVIEKLLMNIGNLGTR